MAAAAMSIPSAAEIAVLMREVGLPRIPASKLRYDAGRDKLGAGSYGIVFKVSDVSPHRCGRRPRRSCKCGTLPLSVQAQWSDAAEPVALKMLDVSGSTLSMDDVRDFAREAALQASLRNPHVVVTFGAVAEDLTSASPRIGIVMELMNSDVVHATANTTTGGGGGAGAGAAARMSTRDRLRIMHQGAIGLAFLHDTGIVHGDFKPGNMLLDKLGNAKVSARLASPRLALPYQCLHAARRSATSASASSSAS